MRSLTAGILATVALLAASCGGGGGGGGSAAGGESGAKLLRSGTFLFVSVDSDLSSSQWKKVDSLLKKFPGRSKLLQSIRDGLAGQQLEYERDIKPALGSEVDFALAGPKYQNPVFVLMTKPDNADKLKALIKKLNEQDSSGSAAVYREVDGWYVLSDKAAKIGEALKAGGGNSLADDKAFTDAMAELPAEALAKAYVNGSGVADAVRQIPTGGQVLSQLGLDQLDFATAGVAAEDDGVRLEAAAKGESARQLTGTTAPFASKLVSDVPAGALAFISLRGGGSVKQLRKQLQSTPGFEEGLRQFEQQLGVKLDDLLPLLENEVAFYIRPGSPLPEFTLLLEEPNEQQAFTTVDKLITGIAPRLNGEVTSTQQDGVTVKTLTVSNFAIHYAAFDNKLVLTSGSRGIADVRSKGDKLPGDSVFKAARAAAGVPDKTSLLIYANLKDGIPLIEDFATVASTDIPQEVRDNLEPLRTFLLYGSSSGDVGKVTAFLEIK